MIVCLQEKRPLYPLYKVKFIMPALTIICFNFIIFLLVKYYNKEDIHAFF